MMNDLNSNDIKIKNIMKSAAGEPRFVEFYSHKESRNHIINADRFCEIFGYTMDDLKEVSHKTDSH